MLRLESEFVADRQTSEETPGPGILVAMLPQQRPHTMGCSRVPIVRQTIDEKSPIDVAVWRDFFASQRTEDDEGGVFWYGLPPRQLPIRLAVASDPSIPRMRAHGPD